MRSFIGCGKDYYRVWGGCLECMIRMSLRCWEVWNMWGDCQEGVVRLPRGSGSM